MANMRLSPGKALKPGSPLRTPAFAPLASLPARDRILIGGCMLAIVALAWAYLLYLGAGLPRSMDESAGAQIAMHGMPMSVQWTAAEALLTLAMWIVMMAGMMGGSAMPVVLLFAGAHARRGGLEARLMALIFGMGYALVWIGFSLLATLAQWALHDAALLSPPMAASSARLSGALLCMAGLYQLTPLKGVCLVHCRSPLGFFMAHWRDGRMGALQMGMRHGAYCLGCCWALMTVLFAVGVMNLAWVAALALLVLVEKIGPAGVVAARVAGVAMIGWGSFLFIGA